MNWQAELSTHYVANWGIRGTPCEFNLGPIWELPADFKVLEFPPRAGRAMWTYATCGMSLPVDCNGIEIHMSSPIQSTAIIELLVSIAHFHRTGERLGLWHTVNFGRPWLANSLCSFGLISLPYLDGPSLENFASPNGSTSFYWMIPITNRELELELKKSKGIEALETLFESSGFNYCDPERASVV